MGLADGGFLVTWENDNADLVRAQRFDAVGNKIGAEFTVKSGVSVDSPDVGLCERWPYRFMPLAMSRPATPTVYDLDLGSAHDGEQLRRHQPADDFLWQHDNGQAAVWLLHDTSVSARTDAVGPNVGPSWHLIDDGDFNADGRSEFLWQNDSGQAAGLGLNERHEPQRTARSVRIPAHPGTLIGTGDFNGDNKSDILWQGSDGTPAIWLMDGMNDVRSVPPARSIRGRAGRSRAPATSTATASPTSCGRAATARRRSG